MMDGIEIDVPGRVLAQGARAARVNAGEEKCGTTCDEVTRPSARGGMEKRSGGSRAALRRQKKKAKTLDSAPATGDAARQRTIQSSLRKLRHPAQSHQLSDSTASEQADVKALLQQLLLQQRYPEWELPLPTDGPLYDTMLLAVSQASTITGRKYRYGAILMAGEDHIPMKSGSNKTPFQRDAIHAEMSVLKGCPRPEGKDMMIAPARARQAHRHQDRRQRRRGRRQRDDRDALRVPPPELKDVPTKRDGYGKILNARPCARCESKMVERGVRRCYFTVNGTTLGVLEYNPE